MLLPFLSFRGRGNAWNNLMTFYLVSRPLALFLVAAAFGATDETVAQRPTPSSISSFVNPAAPMTGVLGANGVFRFAGGVMFQGQARFYLGTPGSSRAVEARTITLTVDASKNVMLKHGQSSFRLRTHSALACPLARFVQRSGLVAFTVPPQMNPAELKKLELQAAPIDKYPTAHIAKEFQGTSFKQLLASADFAQTSNLPDALRRRIVARLSPGVKPRRATPESGALWFNTDHQVTYQVYLGARIHINGRPLRYYWEPAPAGGASVYDVEIFSQTWQGQPRLSDFRTSGLRPTQFDIVTMYQTAGVFRQVRRTNPAAFQRFVTAVCRA